MDRAPVPGVLRAVMRNFATGVCIATTYRGDGPERRHDAITVNSLTSVSLDPPLVSLCLRHESGFLADLTATGKWALSILEGGEDMTAARFAAVRAARTAALSELPAGIAQRTGALVLDGHSWLECELWDAFDLGDHKMVIGHVVSVNVTPQARSALAFLHGRYRTLTPRGTVPDLPGLPGLVAALATPVSTPVHRPAKAGAPRGATP